MRATDSVALVVCLCFADSLDDGDKLYLRYLKDAREDDANCGARASMTLIEIGEVSNSMLDCPVAVRERVDLGAERGDPVAARVCDPALLLPRCCAGRLVRR